MKILRKRTAPALMAVIATAIVIAMSGTAATASPNLAPVGAGHDISTATLANAYRYGPSFIRNTDGTIDMWTCSPGGGGSYDYIRYSRSTNDGASFENEQLVLQPTKTAGSADYASVCDPGVVKFGGYYYLSYTGTTGPNQPNNVFVARSTSPGGPFEKWNGAGWGGSPQPYISYLGTDGAYGDGEPSLVVMDSTLYIYYSEYTATSNKTLVATASTASANWPATVSLRGTAIVRDGVLDQAAPTVPIQDSSDHKYVPSLGKFIAVATANRFTPNFYVRVYESTDGITYTEASQITQNLMGNGHNMGISGNELGQFDPLAHNFIAYAYGTTWGLWSTHLQPFTLSDVTTAVNLERNFTSGTFTNYADIAGDVQRLQPFTVDGSTLGRIDIWTARTGSPSKPLAVQVYAVDSSHLPLGLPLYTTVLPASSVSTTPGWLTINPRVTNLVPGGTYGLVLLSPGSTGGSYGFGYNDTNLYPGFSERLSTNASASWTSEANRTVKFATYGSAVPDQSNVTAAFTDYSDVHATTQRLQSFTASATTLTELDIWTSATSPTGDLTVAIYRIDSSDNPVGSALYTTRVQPVLVPATSSFYRVYPNLTGLTAGAKYAFVLSSPSSLGFGTYGWAYNDSNPYAGGVERYSTDGGNVWVTEPNRDLKFATFK